MEGSCEVKRIFTLRIEEWELNLIRIWGNQATARTTELAREHRDLLDEITELLLGEEENVGV